MTWFSNLKVGVKLIAGFLAVAVIAGAIGAVGIIKIRQIDEADLKLYEKVTVPMGDLANMSIAFQRMRINLRDIVETKDQKERQAALETFKELRRTIGERADKFEKCIISDEGRRLFAEFKESRTV